MIPQSNIIFLRPNSQVSKLKSSLADASEESFPKHCKHLEFWILQLKAAYGAGNRPPAVINTGCYNKHGCRWSWVLLCSQRKFKKGVKTQFYRPQCNKLKTESSANGFKESRSIKWKNILCCILVFRARPELSFGEWECVRDVGVCIRACINTPSAMSENVTS